MERQVPTAANGVEEMAVADIAVEMEKTEGRDSNTKCRSNDSSSAESVCSFRKEYPQQQQQQQQQDGGSDDKVSGDLENEGQLPLRRSQTGFLSPRLKDHRKKILRIFLQTNLLLGAVVITVLSIYWGAAYNRDHYMFKVSVLTVIQDESEVVPVTMTQELPSLISSVPCTWHVYSQSEFMDEYNVTVDEISDKVRDLVYGEQYWLALNAKPNATDDLYNTLLGNTDGNRSFTPDSYFDVWFMSGRDPSSVRASILPNMQTLENLYANYYRSTYLPQLISNITSRGDQDAATIDPATVINVSDMKFNYIDYRSFYDTVLLSPLQVGLIYCLLLTFFQLSLFGPLHAEMAQLLKPKHMIIYRIAISWLTYFLLSLFFCTVSAIYRINFTLAFGRGGFVVYWMSTWLLMMALGGANENMISVIFVYGPQYLGFWLTTWIVLNISCSFYPFVLNNQFYRYGYAMPIHNGVDIYKVIFLNLSRHKMGRNYGVLVAWVAINTACFPFAMKIVGQRIKKQKEAAAQQQEQQQLLQASAKS